MKAARAERYSGTADEQMRKCARRLARGIRTAALDVEDLYQVGHVAVLEGKGGFIYQAMIDELRRMHVRLSVVAQREARRISLDRILALALFADSQTVEKSALAFLLEVERAMGGVLTPEQIVGIDRLMSGLSREDRAILAGQARGQSAQEIAGTAGLKKNRVDYRSHVLRKTIKQEVLS